MGFDVRRLPSLDAATVLETLALEIYRDQFGFLACCTRGIGPRRKKLGPIAETPGFTISPEEMARDGARQLLAGMCHVCPFGQCKMKTWDRITG